MVVEPSLGGQSKFLNWNRRRSRGSQEEEREGGAVGEGGRKGQEWTGVGRRTRGAGRGERQPGREKRGHGREPGKESIEGDRRGQE